MNILIIQQFISNPAGYKNINNKFLIRPKLLIKNKFNRYIIFLILEVQIILKMYTLFSLIVSNIVMC
jgi:hypothetical protein